MGNACCHHRIDVHQDASGSDAATPVAELPQQQELIGINARTQVQAGKMYLPKGSVRAMSSTAIASAKVFEGVVALLNVGSDFADANAYPLLPPVVRPLLESRGTSAVDRMNLPFSLRNINAREEAMMAKYDMVEILIGAREFEAAYHFIAKAFNAFFDGFELQGSLETPMINHRHLRTMIPEIPVDDAEASLLLFNLGLMYYECGCHRNSVACQQHAQHCLRQSLNRKWVKPQDQDNAKEGVQYNKGVVLNALGSSHQERREYGKAIACFRDAMQAEADHQGTMTGRIGWIINNLAICYYKLDRPRRALQYANLVKDRLPCSDMAIIANDQIRRWAVSELAQRRQLQVKLKEAASLQSIDQYRSHPVTKFLLQKAAQRGSLNLVEQLVKERLGKAQIFASKLFEIADGPELKSHEQRLLMGQPTEADVDIKTSIQLFLSSTFDDMQAERNWLWRFALPRIQNESNSLFGIDCELVDMRWGIRDAVSDVHGTSMLCLTELARCQRESLGPSLLLLKGQRYGTKFLPSTVRNSTAEALLLHLSESMREAFQKFYALDQNAVPAHFVLRPVHEFGDRTVYWPMGDRKALQDALAEAAGIALNADERPPFQASVTHLELLQADLNETLDWCCFERKLQGMEHSNPLARSFLDLDANGKLDEAAQDGLRAMATLVNLESIELPDEFTDAVHGSSANGNLLSIARPFWVEQDPLQQPFDVANTNVFYFVEFCRWLHERVITSLQAKCSQYFATHSQDPKFQCIQRHCAKMRELRTEAPLSAAISSKIEALLLRSNPSSTIECSTNDLDVVIAHCFALALGDDAARVVAYVTPRLDTLLSAQATQVVWHLQQPHQGPVTWIADESTYQCVVDGGFTIPHNVRIMRIVDKPMVTSDLRLDALYPIADFNVCLMVRLGQLQRTLSTKQQDDLQQLIDACATDFQCDSLKFRLICHQLLRLRSDQSIVELIPSFHLEDLFAKYLEHATDLSGTCLVSKLLTAVLALGSQATSELLWRLCSSDDDVLDDIFHYHPMMASTAGASPLIPTHVWRLLLANLSLMLMPSLEGSDSAYIFTSPVVQTFVEKIILPANRTSFNVVVLDYLLATYCNNEACHDHACAALPLTAAVMNDVALLEKLLYQVHVAANLTQLTEAELAAIARVLPRKQLEIASGYLQEREPSLLRKQAQDGLNRLRSAGDLPEVRTTETLSQTDVDTLLLTRNWSTGLPVNVVESLDSFKVEFYIACVAMVNEEFTECRLQFGRARRIPSASVKHQARCAALYHVASLLQMKPEAQSLRAAMQAITNSVDLLTVWKSVVIHPQRAAMVWPIVLERAKLSMLNSFLPEYVNIDTAFYIWRTECLLAADAPSSECATEAVIAVIDHKAPFDQKSLRRVPVLTTTDGNHLRTAILQCKAGMSPAEHECIPIAEAFIALAEGNVPEAQSLSRSFFAQQAANLSANILQVEMLLYAGKVNDALAKLSKWEEGDSLKVNANGIIIDRFSPASFSNRLLTAIYASDQHTTSESCVNTFFELREVYGTTAIPRWNILLHSRPVIDPGWLAFGTLKLCLEQYPYSVSEALATVDLLLDLPACGPGSEARCHKLAFETLLQHFQTFDRARYKNLPHAVVWIWLTNRQTEAANYDIGLWELFVHDPNRWNRLQTFLGRFKSQARRESLGTQVIEFTFAELSKLHKAIMEGLLLMPSIISRLKELTQLADKLAPLHAKYAVVKSDIAVLTALATFFQAHGQIVPENLSKLLPSEEEAVVESTYAAHLTFLKACAISLDALRSTVTLLKKQCTSATDALRWDLMFIAANPPNAKAYANMLPTVRAALALDPSKALGPILAGHMIISARNDPDSTLSQQLDQWLAIFDTHLSPALRAMLAEIDQQFALTMDAKVESARALLAVMDEFRPEYSQLNESVRSSCVDIVNAGELAVGNSLLHQLADLENSKGSGEATGQVIAQIQQSAQSRVLMQALAEISRTLESHSEQDLLNLQGRMVDTLGVPDPAQFALLEVFRAVKRVHQGDATLVLPCVELLEDVLNNRSGGYTPLYHISLLSLTDRDILIEMLQASQDEHAHATILVKLIEFEAEIDRLLANPEKMTRDFQDTCRWLATTVYLHFDNAMSLIQALLKHYGDITHDRTPSVMAGILNLQAAEILYKFLDQPVLESIFDHCHYGKQLPMIVQIPDSVRDPARQRHDRLQQLQDYARQAISILRFHVSSGDGQLDYLLPDSGFDGRTLRVAIVSAYKWLLLALQAAGKPWEATAVISEMQEFCTFEVDDPELQNLLTSPHELLAVRGGYANPGAIPVES
eukprot:m.293581 g.293581  ORF g.293581 m.293581 type:complete len:2306 (-) comp25878_c0_seq1:191-7108(-)